MERMMDRWLINIFLLCVTILVCTQCGERKSTLPYFNTAEFTPEWVSADEPKYDSLHTIADFSFINQDNQTITNANFDGRIYIADFFFTTCPGICPQMTQNMVRLQENYFDNDRIMLLSHSVTPWMDTVMQLQKYAVANGVDSKKWHLVTGDKEVIYNIARTSYFAEKEIGLQLDTDDFLHTENFLLIDTKRRIRGIYNGTIDAEMDRLMEDVDILLAETE